MSTDDFQQQERALFDLLFDAALRERFAHDRHAALAAYKLSDGALRDFDSIRLDALELDARMRSDMILASFSKALPLSFCLVSSCNNGLSVLRQLLDTKTMRTTPNDRIVFVAGRLRAALPSLGLEATREIHLVTAIIDLEHSMAWTAATRRKAAIEQHDVANPATALAADWLQRPLQLAPYVNAGVLPQSYAALKQQLCPCDDAGLWRELNRNPVSAEKRRNILQQYEPRLLVARAWLQHASHFDPVAEHLTLELSEGFASLFQHVNGENSVADILAGLGSAGANARIIEGVRDGFRQLLEAGMLVQ